MNIFDYTDYRQFLRDFYDERKASLPSFSFRAMGQKLDLDPGFIVKVMQGQFHLRPACFPQLFELCKFDDRQKCYFETLVQFAKADSERDVKRLFEELLSIKGVNAYKLTDFHYEYYQNWYHSAIRALCNFRQIKVNDHKVVASLLSPKIKISEARESIALLQKLNLVAPDEQGFIRPTESLLTTAPEIRAIAIRHFQRQTMLLAVESLDRHEREQRDISTVTVSVDQEGFDQIREKIRECRESVLAIAQACTTEDRVCQLNMQFFPLTEQDGESC